MTASRPPGRSRLIALYPGAWRRRYGDEFADLLAERPPSPRDRIDIVRGALDAHLHPSEPSLLPGIAAVVGGGVWIVGTWPILALPAPPDWPGYLLEAIPLAIGAVIALTVAVIGAWLRLDRTADRRARRLGGLGLGLAVVGHLVWAVLLVATLSGAGYGWPVAVASTLAGVGTLLVGLALVRVGDWPIAGLLVAAPVVLALPPAAAPSTIAWLAFGGLWIAIGIVELLEDRRGLDRSGPGLFGTR